MTGELPRSGSGFSFLTGTGLDLGDGLGVLPGVLPLPLPLLGLEPVARPPGVGGS